MWSPDVVQAPSSDGSYRVIATPDVLAATPAAGAYQLQPPLDAVFMGDDRNAPTQTVAFAFPDQTTAQSVLAAYWAPDSDA